jgi:signal transduction histidine kinase
VTPALNSLTARLLALWTLALIASVAVGVLLVQLYQQSARAQLAHGRAALTHACELIAGRYEFYTAGWTGPTPKQSDSALRDDLTAVAAFALANQDGVEGGIWQTDAGSLAYAFPTYQGTGPKTDLPVAERDRIMAVNQEAERNGQPVSQDTTSRSQILLLHACPLTGPISGLTAWVMTRVQAAAGVRPLQFGLGVLLALMILMSAALGRLLIVWGRHVRNIEHALSAAGSDRMPAVPRTGERELDRIIGALNDAGLRLANARLEADRMTERVARAERLAGLGRVAAGVAHEIRNPIAAARLQGENALAGDDARRRQAIGEMLRQIDRLDDLVSELLAMTQRVVPRPRRVGLAAFLESQIARHKETASARQLALRIGGADGSAFLDPAVIGRVLDNLLSNAIRHAPCNGAVTLTAERDATSLRLSVEDNGPGVPPEMVDHLFEPFVTGRADGTGLGLAIARELAEAHDGKLILHPRTPGQGAVFVLTLANWDEDTWPRS